MNRVLKGEGPGRRFESRPSIATRVGGLNLEGLRLRSFVLGLESNRDDWIRTSDLFHPKEARYQAAPRPVYTEAFRTFAFNV